VKILLPTAEDTLALGADLAGIAVPGDLLVLAGPLGAGKTVLAKGLGAGLGIRRRVTSPTFVLSRVYLEGRLPMVHVDAYRLGSTSEVDDLDLEEFTDTSVTVVEWGLGLVEHLAEAHLLVELDSRRADGVREATLAPTGGDWMSRLSVLARRRRAMA